MSFLPRLEFRVVFNHGEESLPAASHLFSAQRSIAHTCVLALATRLQSRFLHVILLVYAHLLTWKVGSVRSTHCYFLMVLLSCRKLGKRVAFPGNLRRNDSGILQSPEPHPSCPSTAFTSADCASGPFGAVIAIRERGLQLQSTTFRVCGTRWCELVLGMAYLVAFSTDFRQFEQYLNVPELHVCCTCVSLSYLPDIHVRAR